LAAVCSAAPQTQALTAGDANLATVQQYCVGCHSDKARAGGATFQGITAGSIAKDPMRPANTLRTTCTAAPFQDYELVGVRWIGGGARANAGYCRNANDSVELQQ
jgi:hypothetical protein